MFSSASVDYRSRRASTACLVGTQHTRPSILCPPCSGLALCCRAFESRVRSIAMRSSIALESRFVPHQFTQGSLCLATLKSLARQKSSPSAGGCCSLASRCSAASASRELHLVGSWSLWSSAPCHGCCFAGLGCVSGRLHAIRCNLSNRQFNPCIASNTPVAKGHLAA